ncbi:MAG: hypothetical protein JWR69_2671 [Pedosphaera sp.]|nr:hypothetical protein [Pedosphaera sp.]
MRTINLPRVRSLIGGTTPLRPGHIGLLLLLCLCLGPTAHAATMTPIAATGWNRDVIIESTASGPPYTNAALEFNPGEPRAYYQTNLAGKTRGLPSGPFVSALGDGTVFQFQPFTNNNALVLSSETGLTNGTLTLVTPATYSSIAVLANSGTGTGATANVTLRFQDGTTFVTTYNAPNWFNDPNNIALQGVERIDLTAGTTTGGTTNPRFHQTTLNLTALLGATNKPLASISFDKALANSTGIYALSGQLAPTVVPIAVTGFNRDLVVENTAVGPPYAAAVEFNPGENTTFYQQGLAGTANGLPASGYFVSATDDGTAFLFQPYTNSNALVLSSATGLTSGTLTLATPAVYSTLAILANSGSGGGTPNLTLNFADGTSFVTTYNAPDWFFATANVALLGVDRINLTSGTAQGGPSDPRFYETLLDLTTLLNGTNKALASLTFAQAAGAGVTAIYAVSGTLGSQTNILATLATITNLPASGILAKSAAIAGQVLSTGGNTPAVTLYYGPTDGGTNPAAWAQNLALGGQSAFFSQTISGLSSNTTYYFTASATNTAGLTWATPSRNFTTLASNPATPLVPMLTYHNDNARLGANTNEAILTLANVNANNFGKLLSYSVDGYIYAQPLVMTNVNIPGKGIHNVVYVVTEHGSVYAFDADGTAGAAPLWQISFLNPAAGVTSVPGGDVGTADIVPEVGITATPVIDPATATMYLEAKTKEVTGGNTTYVHRLHALDLATGSERTNGPVFNSPVIINVTNYPGTGTPGYNDNDGAGHVVFNTQREHSRTALTRVNGVLYIAYASHGDNQPYHGWLFAYNAQTLAQLSVYNTTPNGGLGGFWQGGGGATVDAAGNFYFITGNGSFNATGATFSQATNSFSMSVLKFAPTNGILTLVDYFSPHDQAALSGGDADFGSGAAIVLPDSVGSAAHPRLLAAAGKGGRVYLLDRDNLGRFNAANDNQIVQTLPNAMGGGQNGSYMTPAFFNNTLYYIGMNDYLKAFPMSGGLLSTATPKQSPTFYGDKGSSSPSISANGTSNAIVWAIESDAYASSGPAILHAYNATNVALELYNSNQNPVRDNPGGAVKFIVPTVVNGKVYVGAQYTLSIFGNATFLATPVIAPNGGIFTNSVTVTLSDSTPGATLYYTLDGTTPTTNSTLYTSPFVITNTLGVQVIATKPGAQNSGVVSAGFLNSSSIGTGTGLLASYWSNLTAAAFDTAGFATPPTLVRTDAVVNTNWGTGSPAPSISVDQFIGRWTGAVQPQFNETYTFYTTTDDGVRVWVNNQLLIDHWVNQGPTTWSGTIALKAQQRYNIRMEYFENGGGAQAMLYWSSPSTAQVIIPQTQLYPVTNPPPVVVLTGPAGGSTYTASASVTLTANAAAQYNTLSSVAFYANATLLGTLTNAPYILTATGLSAGSYALTAIASDLTGLTGTSAPVNITVTAGSGLPYGLTSRAAVTPFLNMPATVNGSLPTLLSQTGVFTNTPAMGVTGGLIPYNPISPLWSDSALKTRWLAVPNSGAPYTPDEQITFASTGEWTFPTGTIFVKHFELATDETNVNAPKRRLETRLIVRNPGGSVYGVTYKWRADNSDADLLATSVNEDIIITNATGVRTQTWYYPSPADCLTCHTPAANYVLGVKTRQLNETLNYPTTGQTDNQLRTLNRLGLFYPAIPESSITNYSKLVAPTNQSSLLVDRARSYLDANCANCHRPGGTGPTFDAQWDTPLANQNIINALATKGDLGFDNAKIVTSHDVWRSVLYDRMNTLDSTVKMPPLARNQIDTNSLAVIAAWINSLPGTPALAPPVIVPAGGTFNKFVNVTLQAPDTNATLYFTLDGSLPTPSSFLYSGAFSLTNSATLRANAFQAGFNSSVAANGIFTVLPDVVFSAPPGFTNGTFQLQVSGLVGKSYVLQASTNLVDWVSLNTNTPNATPFSLVDPGASNFPARFYRAVQLP